MEKQTEKRCERCWEGTSPSHDGPNQQENHKTEAIDDPTLVQLFLKMLTKAAVWKAYFIMLEECLCSYR